MSPSAEKVQCPFCLGYRRVKGDGTMYFHDWGRRGMLVRCPGAGKTKEQAKTDKGLGISTVLPSGQQDSLQPEDIF